ncbi:hypothetical protein PSHT_10288 [Puccinia striiformis]|uniref:Glycoside hydrolase family 5 domain-containing protein n=1 Tax=Puccinia striiformis TaxID=27350 RepID=A0A2S4VAK9_9BASI|nr:hypothetical protein PSHT_10288 [Puccinia striiformis]
MLVCLASLVVVVLVSQADAKLPITYKYGTNLGGWLLVIRILNSESEPWMNPVEWAEIGGEYCPTDAASCVASEWSLARKLGQKSANVAFLKHWQSWFTQDHVNQLKALKLDHWIVEELVEAPAELYAQGGWMELKRGLHQLRDAGFHVTLAMHALPGVSASNQMFAGNVTSDVQFYKDHNYQRALTWSAVMTSMSHLDPDFTSVVAIECINEPLSDAGLTPGLEQYYSDFVTITRVIEFSIGVKCEADLRKSIGRLSQSKNALVALRAAIPLIVVYAGRGKVDVDPRVLGILESFSINSSPAATAPASVQTGNIQATPRSKISPTITSQSAILKQILPSTMAMPKRWQWKGASNSMANHTLGPAAYEDHMYFAYGGVADPNLKSYLTTMCNQQHYQDARKIGEMPYGHGEFSLANNFNATHDQLRQWGDAQRFIFNQEHFWTFWSFRLGKVMEPKLSQMTVDSWYATLCYMILGHTLKLTGFTMNPRSYLGAVEAGIWPEDPADYFNPSICKPYLKSLGSAANPVMKHSGQESQADSGYY